MRVLLVEDDRTIAEPLVDGLARHGIVTDHVATGAAALAAPPTDMVLLDLGLPDIDGVEVCRLLRSAGDVPLIMLTVPGDEVNRMRGLRVGADDYVAKPINVPELLARMRAVDRRSRPAALANSAAGLIPAGLAKGASGPVPAVRARGASGPVLEALAEGAPRPVAAALPGSEPGSPVGRPQRAAQGGPGEQGSRDPVRRVGPLTLDSRTREVRLHKIPVPLSPKEYDLLLLLATDPGAVVPRRHILDTTWGPGFSGPGKTLDFHVASLRRKLGDPAWIENRRGVGFRLVIPS